MSEEELEKVYVDLPNHWAVGGESMWAKPLRDNLYEIHNTPFYAYGINYLDVVEVDASDETKKPKVIKVFKPSGYRTLRIIFGENFDRKSQSELLEELRTFKVGCERVNDSYVAIDIEPAGDYDAVHNKLSELENAGILEFETCEARNAANFDDLKSEE